MLCLIGTGISSDLTLSSVDEIKRCDEVYFERYTNPMIEERIAEIKKITGKPIILLEREKVESDFLIKQAQTSKVALLSSGDPLTATTHIVLLIEAKKKGIETKVIHNSSIYSAAPGKAGLQMYKFGKTATLVNPRQGYNPRSSLDIIRSNLSYGMHSLVLLDTEPRPMEASAALDMLSEFDNAVVLSRLGESDERISFGDIASLKKADLGKPPFTLIVPTKLHPVEEEYLDLFKIREKD